MKLTDSKKRLLGGGIQLGAMLSFLAALLSYDHVSGLVFGTWVFLMVLGIALVLLGHREQTQAKPQVPYVTPTEVR